MKKTKSYFNIVKISGANSINFINNCISSGIKMHNVKRTSCGEYVFEISDNDYKKINAIDNRGCNITTIELGGKKRVFDFLIYRVGLVIGIIVSMIGVMLFNNRLIQVHILGLTMTNEESVLGCLAELGVTKFSYMNYDIKSIETSLAEEFNFSLVSIITKGNSIIVNIKEELPSLDNSYAPITADYNMVINSIKVYAGTPKVKEGSIVYKGDILVEPYITKGDSTVYVTPTAEIEASLFFSNSYVFKNTEEIFVRTGKKEIVDYEVKLCSLNINKKSKTVEFDSYEVEEYEQIVSSYFLPIFINKTYVFELEKQIVNRNFEEEKKGLIDRQKKLLYDVIPNDIEIKDENIKVTPITDGYIINVYLMSEKLFKYS